MTPPLSEYICFTTLHSSYNYCSTSLKGEFRPHTSCAYMAALYPDLVLDLFADLHRRPVPADLGRERDVPDVGEGVIHHPRFGVVSTQVLEII